MKQSCKLYFTVAIALLVIFIVVDVSRGTEFRSDPVFDKRVNIYDSRGEKKGYLKQDPIFENQINVYNEDGDKGGYFKKDPIIEDRWEYHDH